MKKMLIFLAGLILIGIAFASIGKIIIIGIGLTIAYYSFVSLLKTPSLLGILWWGIAGLFGLSIIVRSIPALIGVAAIAILYYGYKELEKDKKPSANQTKYDEFTNFESQWDSIMCKHN